jgi:hypothetical protein
MSSVNCLYYSDRAKRERERDRDREKERGRETRMRTSREKHPPAKTQDRAEVRGQSVEQMGSPEDLHEPRNQAMFKVGWLCCVGEERGRERERDSERERERESEREAERATERDRETV